MRYLKISIIEEVQIQASRFMEAMVWQPPGAGFNGLEDGKKVKGGDECGEFDSGIQKRRGVLRAIDRKGFINFGGKKRSGVLMECKELSACFSEVAQAVAEIGSQCNSGSHGGDGGAISEGSARPACHTVPVVLNWPTWRRGGPLWRRFRGLRLCG